VEEKLNRRNNYGKGKGQAYRGKGQQTGRGKFSVQKGEAESSSQPEQPQKGRDFKGRISFQRGWGRGRNHEVRCYTCGKTGHMSWDCLEGATRQGNVQVAQAETEQRVPKDHVEILEAGESLLMRITFLKTSKEVHEPEQRKTLFKTMCKSQGKCCKLIIDNGRIDNLVSIEMVEKLGLQSEIHPTPYRVSWLQKGHQVLVNEQ
jgi:hypothetical protein